MHHATRDEQGDVAPVFVIGDRGLSSTDGKTTSKEGDFTSPLARSRGSASAPRTASSSTAEGSAGQHVIPEETDDADAASSLTEIHMQHEASDASTAPHPVGEAQRVHDPGHADLGTVEHVSGGGLSLSFLVLILGGVGLGVLFAQQGFARAGWLGAGVTLGSGGLGVLVTGGLTFVVVKLVSMMFAEDVGSTPEMAGRVGAFVVGGEITLIAFGWAMGPLFAMVASLPVVLVLGVLLLGVSFLPSMMVAIAHMTIRFSIMMLASGPSITEGAGA